MNTFTVPTETCQALFSWTGVQTSFPCGFPALDETALLVQYDSGTQAEFTGSISGPVLSVSAITEGALGLGSPLSGTGIAPRTTISNYGTGTGGVGTYVVNIAQTIGSEALTAAPPPQTLALCF